MDIFRTTLPIHSRIAESFTEGQWKPTQPFNASSGGIILTDVNEMEHDIILNLHDQIDPMGLRGFHVSLIVEQSDFDDPSYINLIAIPIPGQIIRHLDHYYLVKQVLQSTSFNIRVYVRKIHNNELINHF
jgi:hypothetical protein